MEYNPKYPQPFTLHQAIALDPSVALDEIARLNHSLHHLKRTQSELREYLQELVSGEEDLEISQAVKENEITMHDERIFMLKLALTHHGYSVASGPATSPPADIPLPSRPQNTVASNSNGLDDFPPSDHTPPVNLETSHVQEQESGVYL